MRRCPKCGKSWPDEANFCPLDGSKLEILPSHKHKEQTMFEERTADIISDMENGQGPDGSAKKKKFSETQWFLRGVQVEELEEEATYDQLDKLQQQYEYDNSIPDEVRTRFSLSKHRKKKDKNKRPNKT